MSTNLQSKRANMPEPDTVLDNKAVKEPIVETTATAPQSEVCPKEAAVAEMISAVGEDINSKKRCIEEISKTEDHTTDVLSETMSKKLKVDDVVPVKEPEQLTESEP